MRLWSRLGLGLKGLVPIPGNSIDGEGDIFVDVCKLTKLLYIIRFTGTASDNSLKHRRRLHGGDGGDRPHSQKVVGAMPLSRPHKNFDRLISKVHSFNCYVG